MSSCASSGATARADGRSTRSPASTPPIAGVAAGDPLPSPDPRTLLGRLPCQRAYDFLGAGSLFVERLERSGSGVRVVLASGALPARAVRVVDADPADGLVRIDVAGRIAGASPRSGASVTVSLHPRPGAIVTVLIRAASGRFDRLRTRLPRSPGGLVVDLLTSRTGRP